MFDSFFHLIHLLGESAGPMDKRYERYYDRNKRWNKPFRQFMIY